MKVTSWPSCWHQTPMTWGMMLARLAFIIRAYKARVGPLETMSMTPIRSLFMNRGAPAGMHVEIEYGLPHGDEEDGVARLAEVLLGDLQFDRLVGFLQRSEEGRRGLAHLKIDGAVFDLHDDVVVELAVEGLEVVVGRAAAVVLGVGPVGVVVVDEATVKKQTAVGLVQSAWWS